MVVGLVLISLHRRAPFMITRLVNVNMKEQLGNKVYLASLLEWRINLSTVRES